MARRIGGCSVALVSFSLVVKHTMRQVLPAFVPWSCFEHKGWTSFSSSIWWLSASSEWSFFMLKQEECQEWRRQNPMRLCSSYPYDWKGDTIASFWPKAVLDSASNWQNYQRHWLKFPFLHSICITLTGVLYKEISENWFWKTPDIHCCTDFPIFLSRWTNPRDITVINW